MGSMVISQTYCDVIPIARQWVGKHIPATHARKNRTFVAR
jgi:hypothetical protein